MNLYSLPSLLMSAVCCYVGFYYFWMYIRRRFDHANIFFALSCFTIAAYDIFCAGLYNSTSPLQGMGWQRWQFASLALFTITTSWFFYHFTHYGRRLPMIIITVWHGILFVLGLAVRNELTLSASRPKPKFIELFGVAEHYLQRGRSGDHLRYTVCFNARHLGLPAGDPGRSLSQR